MVNKWFIAIVRYEGLGNKSMYFIFFAVNKNNAVTIPIITAEGPMLLVGATSG
jgi:hypothetical protein